MCFSQSKWNAGIGFGGINYFRDLQDKKITTVGMQINATAGIGYQALPHLAANLNFTVGKISATDRTNGPKWYYRNLSFRSQIFEAALTVEYDIFDITPDGESNSLYESARKFTPYIFVGVGAFHYNPYTDDQSGKKVYLQPLGTEGQLTPYPLWQFCIPYGIGVKYAVTDDFLIGGEFNLRKLFTDYLDDASHFHYIDTTVLLASHGQEAASLSYRADEIPGTKYQFWGYRGNPEKKDGYYSFLIKASFRLFTHRPKFYYGY